MPEPSYPLARPAADAAVAALARHLAAAGMDPAHAPDADAGATATILDAAFWASLLREELRTPRISLALLPPERAGEAAMLEYPIPLAPEALARLAPAVERPGIHLGVWRDGAGELQVWGAARVLPDGCLVFEVVEPGLVVLKYRRGEEYGKYGNIAVLRGDHLEVVDERSAAFPDCPELLATLLGLDEGPSWSKAAQPLVQLAISMRAHGRGGLLLVVPAGSDRWRESVVGPGLYAIAPAFGRLARLLGSPPAAGAEAAWREELRRAVDGIAGLTAVDGAAVITDRCELLAFGAKIGRRDGGAQVTELVVTHAVADDAPRTAAPSRLGGTRHLAAAQFVHDQRDALALVASQDGRFTALAWSEREGMVHAHRIETLLM